MGGRSSSSPAKPEVPVHNAEKVPWCLERRFRKQEKDLMGAVCGGDLKKAEELLSEHGPSLLSGLSSHAIAHTARAGKREMCDLLLAHGAVQGSKKGGRKQLPSHLKETRHLSVPRSSKLASIVQKTSWPDRDMHKKENQSASHRGRSTSVPDISQPMINGPKRARSNTRPRRKSV